MPAKDGLKDAAASSGNGLAQKRDSSLAAILNSRRSRTCGSRENLPDSSGTGLSEGCSRCDAASSAAAVPTHTTHVWLGTPRRRSTLHLLGRSGFVMPAHACKGWPEGRGGVGLRMSRAQNAPPRLAATVSSRRSRTRGSRETTPRPPSESLQGSGGRSRRDAASSSAQARSPHTRPVASQPASYSRGRSSLRSSRDVGPRGYCSCVAVCTGTTTQRNTVGSNGCTDTPLPSDGDAHLRAVSRTREDLGARPGKHAPADGDDGAMQWGCW
ncbi:hypothetical protein ABB37_08942 [Leptomonas pyrrhocoris]|uniref:Uncharacterized protein n=1 Tax=Leptomonas pyrrhocoris TaxID=157538 RepID=A0A0M9FS57_LEPPY|nr:hypothetical protein ABB37_08942 [Leptomonas pyrrhocoris]KPA74980.1 hypothetical protein ABB37_08942 [Leptomonas pyrrhocoris]|eukprot:XP_015653419.1 hypothetical protein ABB37_08942 [Leptomonas pyrrhocoris]